MRLHRSNTLKVLAVLALARAAQGDHFVDGTDNCIDLLDCSHADPPCLFLTQQNTIERIASHFGLPGPTEDLACEIGLGMADESCAGDTGKTQWYRLVPTQNGVVDVTLTNCTFNSVVSIWDDCYGNLCKGDPDELACSNPSGNNSAISNFSVQAFTDYWVKVAGLVGQDDFNTACTVHISFDPEEPPNDNCVNSELFPSANATITDDITTATIEAGEPQETCDDGDNGVSQSVWCSFQPTVPGVVNLDTNGSRTNWDPVLSVFTGSCGSPTQVACDDDSGDGFNAAIIDLPVNAFTFYRVKVANDDAEQDNDPDLQLHFLFQPYPTLSFTGAPYTHSESGSQTVTVTPSGPAVVPMSVDYATVAGGTATPGTDFNSTSGTLNWAVGDGAAKSFSVTILADTCDESDETIRVRISNAVGAVIDITHTTTINITDNDAPPTLTLSPSASVSESAANATFQVNLSGCSTQTVSVDYLTGAGTAAGGQDYTPVDGTLTWVPGDTSPKSIVIPLLDDECDEPTQTVPLLLTDPINATIGGTNPVTLSLTDDDDVPSVAFTSAPYVIGETSGTAEITVTLTGCSSQQARVNYATSNGTATAPGDYTATSGTLTWNPGETGPRTFTIPINVDAFNEANETVNLTLSNNVNCTLGTPSTTTLTITDDDPPPVVSFSGAPYTHAELGFPSIFQTVTVRISAAPGITTRVTVATSNGTARAGEDYTATAPTILTWNPGDGANKTINVPLLLDNCDEPNETINVTLSNPVNCTIGAPNPTTITITDNDDPPVVSFIDPPFLVAESDDQANVKVGISGCSSQSTSVRFATSDGTATRFGTSPDYRLASGILAWAPGETDSKGFDVLILADICEEPNETVKRHPQFAGQLHHRPCQSHPRHHPQ